MGIQKKQSFFKTNVTPKWTDLKKDITQYVSGTSTHYKARQITNLLQTLEDEKRKQIVDTLFPKNPQGGANLSEGIWSKNHPNKIFTNQGSRLNKLQTKTLKALYPPFKYDDTIQLDRAQVQRRIKNQLTTASQFKEKFEDTFFDDKDYFTKMAYSPSFLPSTKSTRTQKAKKMLK